MKDALEAPNPPRPHWVDRLFGLLAGVVLGPLARLLAALLLAVGGLSWWWFLLLPPAGLVVGPIVGGLFPRGAIYLFDHTSVLGRPLSHWVVEWVT